MCANVHINIVKKYISFSTLHFKGIESIVTRSNKDQPIFYVLIHICILDS